MMHNGESTSSFRQDQNRNITLRGASESVCVINICVMDLIFVVILFYPNADAEGGVGIPLQTTTGQGHCPLFSRLRNILGS